MTDPDPSERSETEVAEIAAALAAAERRGIERAAELVETDRCVQSRFGYSIKARPFTPTEYAKRIRALLPAEPEETT